MAIEPYRIAVPAGKIEALKARLAPGTLLLPDELEDAGWSRGTPLAEVQRLAAYWRDEYDWRKAERRLNELLPQFTTPIQVDGGEFEALRIHFVHKRSDDVDGAIPLLFVHGCETLSFSLSLRPLFFFP